MAIRVNPYCDVLYVKSRLSQKSGWVVWVECDALLRAIGNRTGVLSDATIFVQKMFMVVVSFRFRDGIFQFPVKTGIK